MPKKILIAYFSHSGRTEQIAKEIRDMKKGDLFAIKPEKAYPENYSEALRVSKPEWEQRITPPIKGQIKHMASYEMIFVGSPNWFGTFAPPVFTFLSQYDFSGKIVAPFITHGGGGAQAAFDEVAEAVPTCTVTEGLAISRLELVDAPLLIEDWLEVIEVE